MGMGIAFTTFVSRTYPVVSPLNNRRFWEGIESVTSEPEKWIALPISTIDENTVKVFDVNHKLVEIRIKKL